MSYLLILLVLFVWKSPKWYTCVNWLVCKNRQIYSISSFWMDTLGLVYANGVVFNNQPVTPSSAYDAMTR